ncbi:MAG: beta-ketoacyl synthase N-terminal-like domain-containing protein, partial [Lachnospiraceae bacterium]
MKKRVVVTGLGVVSPIGNNVEDFWQGIKEEKIGFAPITYFDTTNFKCKLAAELKDFYPEEYMDKKSARRMELFCQYA